jgi:hypothetical protein
MDGLAQPDSAADDLHERRRSVRRALLSGSLIWSLFFGLDIFAVRIGGAHEVTSEGSALELANALEGALAAGSPGIELRSAEVGHAR